MPADDDPDVLALFDDDQLVNQALADAVRETLLRHKQLGQPIVACRDGKVVWVPAEQIEVDKTLQTP